MRVSTASGPILTVPLNRMKRQLLFNAAVALWSMAAVLGAPPATPDLFVGPFPHWLNVKAHFAALGDGLSDDTAALQKAFDAVEENKGFKTLYLPAGIYRLSKTLTMKAAGNLRIVGESPEAVVLKWDGPVNQDVLFFNGVRFVQLGRLTLRGSGRAGVGLHIGIDYGNKENLFPTGWGVYDLRFEDLKTGVLAGAPNCQSEATYERCTFRKCNVGVLLKDANTANIWIRHSLFEECGTGITGGYHGTVLNCVFRRSRMVDIGGGDCGYYGVRNCYSVGSRRFFENTDTLDGRPAVLQGNRVIDPTDPHPIVLTGAGPFTVFDNVVRSPAGAEGPVIERGANNNAAALFIGNTFTAGTPEAAIRVHAAGSSGRIIDTHVVSRAEVDTSEPELPRASERIAAEAPNVYQPDGLTGQSIQAAIDRAAAGHHDRLVVVYLKGGLYQVDSTLLIPPAVQLYITGDASNWGGPVRLKWAGEGKGPMVKFVGPGNRATLEHMYLDGAGRAAGIVIDQADQKGGRVLLERVHSEIFSQPVSEVGVMVDGLDWCRVESFGAGLAAETFFRVVGGPQTAAGHETTGGLVGWNACYGGGGSKVRPVLDVDRGGRLLLADAWFENGGWPHRQPILDLGEGKSGAVTIQGYKFQHHSKGVGPSANLRLDGFNGKVSILNMLLQNVVVEIAGDNPGQNVLFATSLWGWGDPNGQVPNSNSKVTIQTKAGRATVINCAQHYPDWETRPGSGVFAHTYPYQYPTGEPTDDWLRGMLAHARAHRPEFGLSPVPTIATDVRLRWLATDHLGDIAVCIKAD